MDLQTILFATLKLVAFLIILYLWIRVIRGQVLPYFNAEEREGSPAQKSTRFPFLPIGGLIVASVATLWLAQAELAYRTPVGTPDRSIDRTRAQQLLDESAKEPEKVPPDNNESLEDRTKRMLDEAKAQNEKAKEDFLKNKKPPQ